MKRILFISLFALLCGCSKPAPEPEPVRDTEEEWLAKLAPAVEALENIAERTKETLFYEDRGIEYWIDLFLYDDRYYYLDEDLDRIRSSEEYLKLKQDVAVWSETADLQNYPKAHKQTYDNVMEIHSLCIEFFGQTQYGYLDYFWYMNESKYNAYKQHNRELYGQITNGIIKIKAVI